MSEETHREHLEPGGVRTWTVVGFAAGFMTLLAVSIGILYVFYDSSVPPRYVPQYRQLPRPRVEANPARELHVLLSKQQHEMSQYRWANKDHTLVAIPIERAMQIIAARGEKAFAPIEANPSGTALPQGARQPAAPPSGASPPRSPAGAPLPGSATGGKP